MLIKAAVLAAARITVVIFNADAVPERDLARSEAVAGRILRHAGVDVRWRRATSADTETRPAEIPLHLLATRPPNLGGDTSGFAHLMPEGSYAGVSYPAVQRSAHELESDDPTFLGAVIAHELGHILLGTGEHSATGVMVARFGWHEIGAAHRGELLFLPPEARRIRAGAARRATIPR
jgi:hypothetical protein